MNSVTAHNPPRFDSIALSDESTVLPSLYMAVRCAMSIINPKRSLSRILSVV